MEMGVYLANFFPFGLIGGVPYMRKGTRLTSGGGIRILQSGGCYREICLRRVVRDVNRRSHGLGTAPEIACLLSTHLLGDLRQSFGRNRRSP